MARVLRGALLIHHPLSYHYIPVLSEFGFRRPCAWCAEAKTLTPVGSSYPPFFFTLRLVHIHYTFPSICSLLHRAPALCGQGLAPRRAGQAAPPTHTHTPPLLARPRKGSTPRCPPPYRPSLGSACSRRSASAPCPASLAKPAAVTPSSSTAPASAPPCSSSSAAPACPP